MTEAGLGLPQALQRCVYRWFSSVHVRHTHVICLGDGRLGDDGGDGRLGDGRFTTAIFIPHFSGFCGLKGWYLSTNLGEDFLRRAMFEECVARKKNVSTLWKNMCDEELLVRLERHRLLTSVSPLLRDLEGAIRRGDADGALVVVSRIDALMRRF